MNRVTRNRVMVQFPTHQRQQTNLLTSSQNANDPAHQITNDVTTDDDLAHRPEVVASLQRNATIVPTTALDLATHATASPRTPQSQAASVVAAHLVTSTQTVPSTETASQLLPNPNRPYGMCKWAMASKTKTPRLKWRA
jgi:hypothetical protein